MNIEDIEKLAELSKIELSEIEKDTLLKDLDGILAYVKQIESVDVPDVKEEYAHRNIWREDEVKNPEFDAQIVADDIALTLEKIGPLKFKVIAYKMLQKIIQAGALGVEIVLSGKLPSERARSWRFAEGYLKKAGESSKEIDRAKSTALTKTGIIGHSV